MAHKTPLVIAGTLSMLAALLHLGCIFGGPEWYRTLGAGEQMAQMAARGELYPTIATSVIASIIAVWGLYAYSAASLLPKLPLLKTALVLITSVYLLRGVLGLILPFVTDSQQIHHNSLTFWVVSSLICCVYGAFYAVGTLSLFRQKPRAVSNELARQ